MVDELFSIFVLVLLSIGSIILAFNTDNIKKFFKALLFAFGVSVIEYWVIGIPFGLTPYAWGILFIVTIIAKLMNDRNEDETSPITSVS